jgi:hypothetical protein
MAAKKKTTTGPAASRGAGSRGSVNDYKKALASRKGKPAQNLGKAAAWAATTALNAVPAGKAASTVAKYTARGRATKITSGEATTKVRQFTQGKNAKITNTPPKKTGVGENSPVKGTKVKVEYKTKKISPKQQAWQESGMKVTKKVQSGAQYVKGAAAGAYVAGNSAANASKKKSDKKKK